MACFPLAPCVCIAEEQDMAEVTKGLENLQETIAICQRVSTALAEANAAEAAPAQTAVTDTLKSLDEVGGKFFLKTMMSVPPTKACRTEASALATLVEQQKWSGVPAAVEKLQKAAQALVTKAKMDGTTIT
jgi:hypothetical protein